MKYYIDKSDTIYTGDMQPGDRVATPEEIRTHMGDPLDNARTAKFAAIVAGANAVKSALSSRFSVIEEDTWPEQEAGARSILGDTSGVKDRTARLIVKDADSMAAAVALVESLATADGVDRKSFAERIVQNAEIAHGAGIQTLLEQRIMEAALKVAEDVAAVEAITVRYSVLEQLDAAG